MLTIQKLIKLPIIAIFAFAGLIAFNSPVFAEGDIPPVSEQVEVSQSGTPSEEIPAALEEPQAASESTPETPPVDAEIVPTEIQEENIEPPVDPVVDLETSNIDNQPSDQASGEEIPVITEIEINETENPEVLSSPAEPNIVVVDQNGEPLPLTTQIAEDTLLAPDPYFFDGTNKYQFTTSDCDPGPDVTACSDPIQAAFDYISSKNISPVGGCVYVEPGTYYSNLVISNSMWGPTAVIPTSLSIIGVKSGVDVLDKTIGSSIDHLIIGSITVEGIKSFTLQAFTVNGSLDGSGSTGSLAFFDSNTGTLNLIDVEINNSGTGNGLVVDHHNGAINLNMVNSSDNGRFGAYINNAVGTSGPVTIKNSSFDRNGLEGLFIKSNGAVTLTGVSASGNLVNGGATISSKGLTINQSVFNNNVTDGLWVDPYILGGNIFIQNSQFNSNTRYGLYIRQDGNVDIKNIQGTGNGESGLVVDTCNWDGDPSTFCWNPYTGNVTVTNSTFTENAQTGGDGINPLDGLNIHAKGIITLTDVYSRNNGDSSQPAYGARLFNQHGVVAWAINVINSTFVDNFQDGLNVISKGIIKVKDIIATGNTTNGATLDNEFPGTVAGISILNSPNLDNDFSENLANGLEIHSNGAVLLNAVKADRNTASGIYVDNHSGTGVVTIDGVSGNTTNDNGGDGIQVISSGLITIKNMAAEQNGGNGLNLNNLSGTGGVSVLATLYGWKNGFSSNGQDGLNVLSNGAVIVQKSTVTNNNHFGAYIDNSSGTGNVTISDSNFDFNGNIFVDPSEYGLFIQSRGNIALTNISASSNGYDDPLNLDDVVTSGVWIDNSTSTLPRPVTITRGSFNNNFGSGLDVNSKGIITLTYVEALGNSAGHGAFINNGGTGGTGSVIISGKSVDDKRSFNGNSDYGLQIISKGAVTIKYMDANNNGSYGASIDNSAAATPLSVSFTAAEFNNNSQTTDGYGLRVYSDGAIIASTLRADNNGNSGSGITANGLELDNCQAVLGLCTGNGIVSLTSVHASGNHGNGMDVLSYGAISILNGIASSNNENGATLTNNTLRANPNSLLSSIPSIGGVSITMPAGYPTSTGMFSYNGGYGLQITTNGAVSLTNVNGTNNDSLDYAAFIDNSSALSPKTVTIIKSRFNNNSSSRGIWVISKGAIVFSNNEVKNNLRSSITDQGAAELDNHTSTLPQNVTVTYGNFHNNTGGDGLLILTKGNVLLTNVFASNNADEGIEVNASYGIGTITVNGTQNTFRSNGGNGMKLLANGNVLVTNITSENNQDGGLSIATFGEAGTGTGTGIITVTNANLNMNTNDGLRASANGAMNLTNITSLGNGIGTNSDGAHLTTNTKDITITNSSFSGNEGSGIWSDTGAGKTLKLNGTAFFGNNTGGTPNPNISYTGLVSIN